MLCYCHWRLSKKIQACCQTASPAQPGSIQTPEEGGGRTLRALVISHLPHGRRSQVWCNCVQRGPRPGSVPPRQRGCGSQAGSRWELRTVKATGFSTLKPVLRLAPNLLLLSCPKSEVIWAKPAPRSFSVSSAGFCNHPLCNQWDCSCGIVY